MSQPAVPQEAITAAATRIHVRSCPGDCGRGGEPYDSELDEAADILEAAAPHLAYAAGKAAGDRIRELSDLAAEILASYHQGSDGYRGRVGQVQIKRWQDRLGEHA
jgi:hypothetical protein